MRRRLLLCGLSVVASEPAFAQAITQDPLPQVYTMTPTGVNLQTGRYNPTYPDLSIGHLKLDRGGPSPSFGNSGIKHNLGGGLYTSLSSPGGHSQINVTVEGKTLRWIQNSSGSWMVWNQEAIGTDLTSSGGIWKLIGRGGETYQFMQHAAYGSGTQVLQYVEYADGTRLNYTYNNLGLLRTLISNRGYAIVLDYGAHNGVVAACGFNTTVTFVDANTTCAAATLKVGYGYTLIGSDYRHTSVTDVDGNVTTYKYSTGPTAPGPLNCVTFPNSQTCRFTLYLGDQPGDPLPHTKGFQVRKQVMVDGSTWLFDYENDYDHEIPPQPGVPVYSQSFMTDPLGNQTTTRYDRGEIIELFEPGGLTQYDLNGSDLTKIVYPDGNSMHLQRDGDRIWTITRKAKPGSGLADIVSSATYPIVRFDPPNDATRPVGCVAASQRLCDKPITRTDANGNVTDYTYDGAHGMVLTETAPAVNGVRAQTRYTYAQRYAWIKNSGGSYVQAATPVSVLTQKSICKSGAASGAGCATGSDEVRTTYDYGPDSGPNNLLLRGIVEDSAGLSLRTCYSYDWLGNKISETKPAVGLASCDAAPASNAVFSISGPAPVNEGTEAVFTINKTGTATGSLTVNYATANGTAVAPDDFAAKALTTLTFLTAETQKTVSVSTVVDSATESPEQFTMNLSSPSAGATLGTASASGTINDVPPPSNVVLSITGPAAPVNEGTDAVFTITKTGTASGSLSVTYATANGTAVAPDDYATKAPTILTFLTAETQKTVLVSTVSDSTAEPSEQFSMNLSSPSAGATLGTASAIGTINVSSGGGANQPPVTALDAGSVGICEYVSINVVANDSDPEGGTLELIGVGTSSKGQTSDEGMTNVGFLAYGATGATSITYTIQDSLGATANGTLNINVVNGSGCN